MKQLEENMDFFEAQDFFKNMYQGKNVQFIFDMDCLREMSYIVTDGKCNEYCHCRYDKVKVLVDGEQNHIVPIGNHRATLKANDMKPELNKMDLHMQPAQLAGE